MAGLASSTSVRNVTLLRPIISTKAVAGSTFSVVSACPSAPDSQACSQGFMLAVAA